MGVVMSPVSGSSQFCSNYFASIVGPGTAVANTTTQTSLFTGATFRPNQSLTIPASPIMAGDSIGIELWGTFSVAGDNATLIITVLLNGAQIMGSNAVGTGATAVTNGEWMIGTQPTRLWFPSVGTSGTCMGRGAFQGVLASPTNSLAGLQLYNGSGGSLGVGTMTTINTTVPVVLDVRAQWGTAAAGNSIQLLGGQIWKCA
jgi:hypothetical protein